MPTSCANSLCSIQNLAQKGPVSSTKRKNNIDKNREKEGQERRAQADSKQAIFSSSASSSLLSSFMAFISKESKVLDVVLVRRRRLCECLSQGAAQGMRSDGTEE